MCGHVHPLLAQLVEEIKEQRLSSGNAKSSEIASVSWNQALVIPDNHDVLLILKQRSKKGNATTDFGEVHAGLA